VAGRIDEDRGRAMFWTKLGGGLAIFGAVFAVATFIVPAGGAIERLLLVTAGISGSALLFWGTQQRAASNA
jgi:hypothetical protein